MLCNKNAEIVSEYYKKEKFPEEDIEAVKETVGIPELCKRRPCKFKRKSPKQPIFKSDASPFKRTLVNPLP